jgi:hypothetical protein
VPDGANWVVLAVGADRTGGISGYLSAQASVPVTHSQTTPQTTLTLPAVSHDVTVSVSSSVGNALAAPVTLNPVTPLPTGTARSILSATLAPTTGVPGGYSVVFSKVPFGTYTVGIDLSATGHGGVLTGGQNTLVLSASTPGPVSDAFTLSEGGLDLSVTTTAKAPDLPLAQVRLTVRKVGASTDIFTATGFDTNQAGPVAIYLPPGLYNVTATPLATAGPGWSAVSTTSPASVQAGATVAKPLTLTEVGPLPLVVHITRNGHNFTFGGTTDTATITLLPLQNQTVPAAYAAAVNANSTGNFTFTGLAPGLYQITTVVTSTPAATTANPTPTAITYNGTTDPTNITLVAGQAGDGGDGQTFNLDAIP